MIQSKNKPARDAGTLQPYEYRYTTEFHEPEWRRIPGYHNVSETDWRSALWQKRNLVKNVKQLKEVLGHFLSDSMAADIIKDQAERATMSMLIPPQMINTMDLENLNTDPVRRYMAPFFSERDREWPSHPMATRDSLHEHDMWVEEGLTHRYPTKVLAELLPTCPQYCGHCTRMDLVGQSVPQVQKRKFEQSQPDRLEKMLEYLAKTKTVRDVVVSGGDIANLPPTVLEKFISRLFEIENIRDIRLASKALMGLPQHFLQDEALHSLERLAKRAREKGVSLAMHTHVNHACQVTPLVAEVSRKLLAMGFRDVRNQGVLLRGVNDSQKALLDLCFRLTDFAGITPYYFYMCDMIPNSEHWRIPLHSAQRLQHDIMGYLPGFSTPRLLCDVPFVGKRWVHQENSYNREQGISYWTKNYLTSIEYDTPEALGKLYEYYDPIDTLSEEGKAFWRKKKAKLNRQSECRGV